MNVIHKEKTGSHRNIPLTPIKIQSSLILVFLKSKSFTPVEKLPYLREVRFSLIYIPILKGSLSHDQDSKIYGINSVQSKIYNKKKLSTSVIPTSRFSKETGVFVYKNLVLD